MDQVNQQLSSPIEPAVEQHGSNNGRNLQISSVSFKVNTKWAGKWTKGIGDYKTNETSSINEVREPAREPIETAAEAIADPGEPCCSKTQQGESALENDPNELGSKWTTKMKSNLNVQVYEVLRRANKARQQVDKVNKQVNNAQCKCTNLSTELI